MLIRRKVGKGDGVTNASMAPETSSTATNPTATATTGTALLGQHLSTRAITGRDH